MELPSHLNSINLKEQNLIIEKKVSLSLFATFTSDTKYLFSNLKRLANKILASSL